MRVSRTFLQGAFSPRQWFVTLKEWTVAVKRWAAAISTAASQGGLATATGRQTWMNTFRARSDGVIAIARIVLAIGSLWVTWLDATIQPVRSDFVSWLLVAYLVYAIVAAHFVWKAQVHQVRGTLIRHVIDVATLIALAFLEGRLSGPVFMLMPFVQLTATLHWLWRGALWTGLVGVAVLAYLALSNTAWLFRSDVDAAVALSFILFLLMATLLLTWLGTHQEAVRSELLRLVERTPSASDGRDWPALAALDYAAQVMRVPRALLIWSDGDEPWTNLAIWQNGTFETRHLSPSAYLPWTPEVLQGASLLIIDAKRSRALIHRGGGRFDRWRGGGSPISPALVAEFSIVSAISVQFEVSDVEARLFLLDPPAQTLDDVAMAEIVADRLKTLFEQAILLRRLSDAAALEERIKIGRDIHDGVLQTLAGTALQLQALRSSKPDLDEIDRRLMAIQAMLFEEQRDLRALIRALEPGSRDDHAGDRQLAPRLEALAERLRQQWSIDFRFSLDPEDLRLPAAVIDELARMIAEACANAARHGNARTLKARLCLDAGTVILTVDDDGTGFGFDRRLEHAELESSKVGPRSLRERVATWGGELSIDKVEQWTRITIKIPAHP
ncbi:sensor histidine kinase [Sinorhizobium psoraleae]|uniref:Sensor histidine kinase n=1 Tax=Sinorhizobium psoraleae TaxID=520838 RepID=A0ABT4KPR9_9HYPH|nr:sensor histidine kinase [Sinorhizobium psoraleae]MCZ4093965.1 sensor histidine kinase [Sinorhizobium psoraleae]